MGIEQCAAAFRENVLAHDVLQERRLARASLADDRNVTPAVELSNAEYPFVTHGVSTPEIRDYIVSVDRFHPPIVAAAANARRGNFLHGWGGCPQGVAEQTKKKTSDLYRWFVLFIGSIN